MATLFVWPWANMNHPERLLAEAERIAGAAKADWRPHFDLDGTCTGAVTGPAMTAELAQAINAAERVRCLNVWQAPSAEVLAELSKNFSEVWTVSHGKASTTQWRRKALGQATPQADNNPERPREEMRQ